MPDALQTLADAIAAGSATTDSQMLAAMRGVFGERYHKRCAPSLEQDRPALIRNAYGGRGGETDHVAYAGSSNPENPSNAPYGGFSVVWFLREEDCPIAFGTGTRGLSPNEGILTRPGHRRRIANLRRHLVAQGAVGAWARHDPATIAVPILHLATKGSLPGIPCSSGKAPCSIACAPCRRRIWPKPALSSKRSWISMRTNADASLAEALMKRLLEHFSELPLGIKALL
jgi:hypothetical protein